MINLKFMNKAVELTDGNEFRLLYVIANTISLKKEGHTKIYRELLADKLNLSTKQISRLTNSLVEKGLIKKDLVSENDKTVCFYSLNLDKKDQLSTSNLDKNVPLNKSKKELLKEIKVNKNKKEEIKEKELNKVEINEDLNTVLKPIKDFEIDWEEELRMLKDKIKETSTVEEIRNLAIHFDELQDKVQVPSHCEEMVKDLKQMANAQIWKLKTINV